MGKKATLLIKNIEKIYTLKKDIIYEHAFLAIHHEMIIGIGKNNYESFVDKDTRIIDARGHFVIPGFIEVEASYPNVEQWNKNYMYASFRNEYMRHGVLTLAMDTDDKFLEVDIVKKKINKRYNIVYLEDILNKKKVVNTKSFCISTKDTTLHISNILSLAQLLYKKQKVEPIQLIKAMTLYPAKMLGLEKIGTIEVGNQADLLICLGNDITCLFKDLDDQKITQIIKKGVRIYPYLLIS